jgi:transcriptional regulator with XRE-family HTH domain
MTPGFGKRLRQARKQAKLTGPYIAKQLGVSPQTISQWERELHHPNADRLAELARLIGVKTDWLLTGQDGPSQGLIDVVGRLVPKIASADLAGYDPSSSIPVVGRPKVLSHFPCGPNSFQSTLWDRSNFPAFEQGDSVIIDPGLEPQPGDMVMAVVDGAAVFRRYRVRDGNVELVPVNTDWPTATCVFGQKGARLLGTMTEHSRQRRA